VRLPRPLNVLRAGGRAHRLGVRCEDERVSVQVSLRPRCVHVRDKPLDDALDIVGRGVADVVPQAVAGSNRIRPGEEGVVVPPPLRPELRVDGPHLFELTDQLLLPDHCDLTPVLVLSGTNAAACAGHPCRTGSRTRCSESTGTSWICSGAGPSCVSTRGTGLPCQFRHLLFLW